MYLWQMLSVKASQAWSSPADFILGGHFLWSSLKILNTTPYSLKSSLAQCAPSVWFTHSSYFKEQTHLITGWWFGAPCLKWREGTMSSSLLPFESANSKKRNQIFVLFLSCLWLLNKAWARELSIPGPAASRASSVLHGVQFSSVQSLSRVQLFATPWTAAHQASLSIANSQSLLKLMSVELVMPSNHLILCRPLLFLPSIFPSIRVFSNESALHIRWPKYWSFSFSISPSNEYSGFISFRMDWFDHLVVQRTRVFSNSTVQKH